MRYRAFGKTGITVSEIGLGAWQLGNRTDWAHGPDEAQSLAIVAAALDAGVTFFDCSARRCAGRSAARWSAACASCRPTCSTSC